MRAITPTGERSTHNIPDCRKGRVSKCKVSINLLNKRSKADFTVGNIYIFTNISKGSQSGMSSIKINWRCVIFQPMVFRSRIYTKSLQALLSSVPRGFAAHSRVLLRLPSLAINGQTGGEKRRPETQSHTKSSSDMPARHIRVNNASKYITHPKEIWILHI